MPSMDGAIGIRRPIVQNKLVVHTRVALLGSTGALPDIQVIGAFLAVGLELCGCRTCWEA